MTRHATYQQNLTDFPLSWVNFTEVEVKQHRTASPYKSGSGIDTGISGLPTQVVGADCQVSRTNHGGDCEIQARALKSTRPFTPHFARVTAHRLLISARALFPILRSQRPLRQHAWPTTIPEQNSGRADAWPILRSSAAWNVTISGCRSPTHFLWRAWRVLP